MSIPFFSSSSGGGGIDPSSGSSSSLAVGPSASLSFHNVLAQHQQQHQQQISAARARDSDIGVPATRDDMRELRDDRSLLNENGELRHQNEFMRSLGMWVTERREGLRRFEYFSNGGIQLNSTSPRRVCIH